MHYRAPLKSCQLILHLLVRCANCFCFQAAHRQEIAAHAKPFVEGKMSAQEAAAAMDGWWGGITASHGGLPSHSDATGTGETKAPMPPARSTGEPKQGERGRVGR